MTLVLDRLVPPSSEPTELQAIDESPARLVEGHAGHKISNSFDKEKKVGTELQSEAQIKANLDMLSTLLDQNRDEEFLSQIDQIMTKFPEVADYAALKSDYYYLKQNWPAAEDAIRHLLNLDPQNTFAKTSLGEVLGIQGRYDEGLEVLDEVLEKEPGNLDALYSTISITDLQGEAVRGIEKVSELYRSHPENGNLAMAYADILLSQGKTSERNETLRRAMKTDPDNPGPYRLAANDESRTGNSQAAIEMAEESLKRDSNPDTRLQSIDLVIRSADSMRDFDRVERYLRMKRELKPWDQTIAAEIEALQENRLAK